MPKLMPLVPSLGGFGPLLMVIGVDSHHYVMSYFGALASSAALLWVFVAVMKIQNSLGHSAVK
jgi:hypothetical protein